MSNFKLIVYKLIKEKEKTHMPNRA